MKQTYECVQCGTHFLTAMTAWVHWWLAHEWYSEFPDA